MGMFTDIFSNTFLLGQIVMFGAIVLIIYNVGNLYNQKRQLSGRLTGTKDGVSAPKKGLKLQLDDGALKTYEKFLTPKDNKRLSSVREALIKAGYRRPSAVRILYAVRVAFGLAGVLVSAVTLPAVMVEMPITITLATMFLIVVICYFAPSFWVERKFQYRRSDIENSFPDALDLLLVCIEAGHSFDQALNRVVKEIETSSPTLADELAVASIEMRVGKDRNKVLEDFAHRTGVDDIRSFITVIKQADKYGVSIAEALRVYSSEMRDKRYMRGEEKANMMPVKLALGAVMFTVPPVIIILIGPSLLMVIRQLGGLM